MQINVDDFNINDKTEELDLNKAVFETVVTGGDFEKNFSVEYGVVNGKQIAYVGAMDDIGEKKESCGQEEESAVIKFSDKHWVVVPIGALLSYCEDDLPQMFKLLKRKQTDSPERYNVIGSDVEKLITAQIEVAIKKLINRIYWLADTSADTTNNGGAFTNGTRLKLVNMLDGILKQLDAEVPAENKFSIEENASSTKTEQFDLANDRALLTFRKAYNMLTPEMWEDIDGGEKLQFEVTPALMRNWENFMEDKALMTSLLTKAEDGVAKHSYRGIPIIVKNDVAVNIAKYKNNGTKLDRPNICILGFKDAKVLGMASKDAFKKLKVWYDEKDEKVYIKFRFEMGMSLIQPDKVIYGR